MRHTIDFGNGRLETFDSDLRKRIDIDDGFFMQTATVRFADGSEHRALLEICERDSGEHWGTAVFYDGGLAAQDDHPEMHIKLGLERRCVYPYKYKLDFPVSGDCHVGADGWSL